MSSKGEQQARGLVDHFFRHEAGRLIATLVRRHGGHRIDAIEDAVQGALGDGFRCRCETYLTDPKIEHRESRWDVDLAIKLADE